MVMVSALPPPPLIFEGVQFISSVSSHTQTERADHSYDQDDHSSALSDLISISNKTGANI